MIALHSQGINSSSHVLPAGSSDPKRCRHDQAKTLASLKTLRVNDRIGKRDHHNEFLCCKHSPNIEPTYYYKLLPYKQLQKIRHIKHNPQINIIRGMYFVYSIV